MCRIGNIYASHGCLTKAMEHYERSVALSREIGDRRAETFALHNLAVVLREAGKPDASEERFMECLALAVEIGHRHLEANTQLELGSLRSTAHGGEAGRDALVRARDIARDFGLPDLETLARCELALLPDGDAQDAITAFSAHEERMESEQRRAARLLLWKATRDPAHLAEAKRLLDFFVEHAPPEHRESMLANVRLHREIAAAAREQGLPRAADS